MSWAEVPTPQHAAGEHGSCPVCAASEDTEQPPREGQQGGTSAVPGDCLHTGLPAAQEVGKGWHTGSGRPATVLGIFYIAPVTFSLLSVYLDFCAIKSC